MDAPQASGRAVARFVPLLVGAGALLVVAVLVVLRHVERGRLAGAWYRLTGRRPDPDVDDPVLADRVRSMLGPLEARLDVPRVHVLVEDHVALLHGAVDWTHQAAAIERAVRSVSGIHGVESHLHIGLARGDTRPSEGRLHLRASRPPDGQP